MTDVERSLSADVHRPRAERADGADPQRTREAQYQRLLDYDAERGLETLGLMSSQSWYDDPRRLTFVLARYKLAAKLFAGTDRVLEVGCGDAFASRIVVQAVGRLTAVDFDPLFVDDARRRMSPRWPFHAAVHDMLEGPFPERFDAAYSLDVLEHIEPANEDRFLGNIARSLVPHGSLLIGMPSLESQDYASALSKEGHVNCKTQPDLRATLLRHFHNVFMLAMNDEVVHTGFHKMAHYIYGLCCGPRVSG